MRPDIMTIMIVCLAALVLYALHRKGNVKASLKIPGAAFSLEATDRAAAPPKEDQGV